MGMLQGKVALVTGASRGIGAAIADSLANEDAAVIVNYHKSEEHVGEVARKIQEKGGKALPLRADASAVEQLVQAAAEAFGPVDILVNNDLPDYKFAPVSRKDFASIDWGDYQHQLGGLKGAFHYSQAVVPGMEEKGEGRIINILTNLINNPVVAYHDYTTAKSAFLGFSRNLASELGPSGITVNMIAGSLIDGTDASAPTTDEVRQIVAGSTPLRRSVSRRTWAAPSSCSPRWSGFVTGPYITCDGGLVTP